LHLKIIVFNIQTAEVQNYFEGE